MKYLIVAFMLISPVAMAEDISYMTDGVYVCCPIDTTRQDQELAYDRYRFDRELDAKIKLGTARQNYVNARMVIDGR